MAVSIAEQYGGSYRIADLTSPAQLPDKVGRIIMVRSVSIAFNPLVRMPRLTSVFRQQGALQHLVVNSSASDKNISVGLFGGNTRIATIPEIPPGSLVEINIDHTGTWSSSHLKTFDESAAL